MFSAALCMLPKTYTNRSSQLKKEKMKINGMIELRTQNQVNIFGSQGYSIINGTLYLGFCKTSDEGIRAQSDLGRLNHPN